MPAVVGSPSNRTRSQKQQEQQRRQKRRQRGLRQSTKSRSAKDVKESVYSPEIIISEEHGQNLGQEASKYQQEFVRLEPEKCINKSTRLSPLAFDEAEGANHFRTEGADAFGEAEGGSNRQNLSKEPSKCQEEFVSLEPEKCINMSTRLTPLAFDEAEGANHFRTEGAGPALPAARSREEDFFSLQPVLAPSSSSDSSDAGHKKFKEALTASSGDGSDHSIDGDESTDANIGDFVSQSGHNYGEDGGPPIILKQFRARGSRRGRHLQNTSHTVPVQYFKQRPSEGTIVSRGEGKGSFDPSDADGILEEFFDSMGEAVDDTLTSMEVMCNAVCRQVPKKC